MLSMFYPCMMFPAFSHKTVTPIQCILFKGGTCRECKITEDDIKDSKDLG